jgi:hypothetical protein
MGADSPFGPLTAGLLIAATLHFAQPAQPQIVIAPEDRARLVKNISGSPSALVSIVRGLTGESIRERYARMSSAAWFRAAHENQSLGETIPVD